MGVNFFFIWEVLMNNIKWWKPLWSRTFDLWTCFKALDCTVCTYWQLVHTVLGYGTAFSSSFSKRNFWSLLDWVRPLKCGLGTMPIIYIYMQLIHIGGRENITLLIKVLQLTVRARIWHLFTAGVVPCQKVIYWLCCHFRQMALSKLIFIFFQDFSSLIFIQLWSFFGIFFHFPDRWRKVIY